jgi:hypothetical protein
MDKLVIIMVRHVKTPEDNKYWKESYQYIRKWYPEVKLIIIDDNSKEAENIELENTEIIQSEYPGRAELLPYYYFHKYHFAEKALVIHDSLFINSRFDFDNVKNFEFIWDFEHTWDDTDVTPQILRKFPNGENLVDLYNKKNLWKGCYGVMSIISWDFLEKMNKELGLFNILLDIITDRANRMRLERIWGVLCTYSDCDKPSKYGQIHPWVYHFTKGRKWWDYSFNEYLSEKNIINSPIIKIWVGR